MTLTHALCLLAALLAGLLWFASRRLEQARAALATEYARGWSDGRDGLVLALRRLVASGAANDLLRGIGAARRFAKTDPLERLPAREGVD